jgi:hypothetical protein
MEIDDEDPGHRAGSALFHQAENGRKGMGRIRHGKDNRDRQLSKSRATLPVGFGRSGSSEVQHQMAQTYKPGETVPRTGNVE